nr:g-type lectin s-receptor-like serine/threonine-protein kinase lecrk2 [Quercus suber]
MALHLSYLLSLLLLVLLLPYSTTAQTSSNQSRDSSLTAQEKGSYWASPFGDFAFGFQKIGNGGYLLAIWFNKIPEKTIVWSANGENLVPTDSKVELTKDGQLVLSDPTGTEIWNSESGNLGVVYAATLDTRNFVLASQDGSLLWQSFDQPTNTMLPTQTMSLGSKLVAHYSERNYSNGRFQFQLQTDGNLVLQTLEFPIDWPNTDYWQSGTTGSGFQVIFNESGSIYLTARNGSILTTIFSNSVSKQDYYQRAVMEYDGVLIHYVYTKSGTNTSNTWSSSSPMPPNICGITEAIGSGACGFNSYCELGGDGRPICKCPTGYTLIDPNDVMKGCRQDFLPQSCYESSSETDQFDLREMRSVNWPFTDYGRYDGVTEDGQESLLGSTFLNLLFLLAAFLLAFRFKYWKRKARNPYQVTPVMNLRSYTYEELIEATNGFKEELGRGAFAKVYKGVLEYEDRKLVAVKRLNNMEREGDMEFNAEVSAIGRTNHRNLVQLLGFCNEGEHRLLVYEFMTKLLKADQTRTTTGIRGTKGKSFEAEAKDEDQMILADWAYDCYNDKKLDLLVENDEEAIDDMKRMEKYVMIAIWCIQEDPSLRPTMKKVVQMMEGSIEVSVPPGSSSFISSM